MNFCEECPPKVLEPYLDDLVRVLEGVLQAKIEELAHRGTKLVLEQALTTIATVADTAEAKFTVYYDLFMPHLKFIFQNATSQEYRLLRGKSIECISLIGLAVGRDKFLPDASDVMELLLQTQSGVDELEADDPQISYLISAWARMCKIIGQEFVNYLSVVMPPVLKAAQIKPEVALLDVDDPSNCDLDEDDGWEFVNLGEQQKFGIKTAGLEDKSTACQMLVHYARELKGGFIDYVEEVVVKIMVPLLKFYFHDTVRVTAAESLPHLLECAKVRGDNYVAQMWAHICPELLSAIEKEPEEAVVPELMDSFSKCVETMNTHCMSGDQLQQLARIIHEKLEQHMARQQERLSKRHDEDYDAEVEDELQDEHESDEYILSKVSDMMHVLFKTHEYDLLPFFDFLLNDFIKLLDPARPSSDKQWTLCIFDDLVEYASPKSWNYKDYFVQPMLKYIHDVHPEVRQAAAYGIGVMAEFGGNNYADICTEAAPMLIQVISQPDARSKENVNPTENCISAITKICKYNSSKLNVDEILPHWFSWLPITEDKEEAPHVYGYLCDLIENNNQAIVGVDHANLPLILKIIATAVAKDVLSNDTVQSAECLDRLKQKVYHVKSNSEVWNNCLMAIEDDELRKTLNNIS